LHLHLFRNEVGHRCAARQFQFDRDRFEELDPEDPIETDPRLCGREHAPIAARAVRRIEAGDLVLIDTGVCLDGYNSDITRTFLVDGEFTSRQREIYDLVLESHDRAAEAMKPGVTMFDLRKIVYKTFEDSGVRNSNGESLGQYFIHGLGHPLGLDRRGVECFRPGLVREAGCILSEDRETLRGRLLLAVEEARQDEPQINGCQWGRLRHQPWPSTWSNNTGNRARWQRQALSRSLCQWLVL